MAITASRVNGANGQAYDVIGAFRQTTTDVTFDTSYPTGGEAFTASDLGLNAINRIVDVSVTTTAAAGNTVDVAAVSVTPTGGLLKANAAAAETANASNLGTLVARVVAQGT